MFLPPKYCTLSSRRTLALFFWFYNGHILVSFTIVFTLEGLTKLLRSLPFLSSVHLHRHDACTDELSDDTRPPFCKIVRQPFRALLMSWLLHWESARYCDCCRYVGSGFDQHRCHFFLISICTLNRMQTSYYYCDKQKKSWSGNNLI